MTVESLKQDYKLGLITATGYLYYIVKVSRKDGWLFVINNVEAFCKEWGFKRGTFYDAKAKCVALGLLKETIHGKVTLQVEASVVPFSSASVENPTGVGIPTGVENPDECPKFQTSVRNSRQDSEISDSDCPQPQATQEPQKSPNSFSDLFQIFLSQLSESERESFWAFGRKQAAQLPNPPTLPDRWIAKHHQELWAQFKENTAAPPADFTNHPQRNEWLEAARTQGAAWFGLCDDLGEAEQRQAFYQWAKRNKLLSGRKL
jgi:hypothetical protein